MVLRGPSAPVYIDNQLYNFVPVGTAIIYVAIIK